MKFHIWMSLAKKGGVLVRKNWDLITDQERRSFLVLIPEMHGFGSHKKEEVLVWHVYFKR